MEVDSRCLKALGKIGLADLAKSLARQLEQSGAAVGSFTMQFLGSYDEPDGDCVAELTITVKRDGGVI